MLENILVLRNTHLSVWSAKRAICQQLIFKWSKNKITGRLGGERERWKDLQSKMEIRVLRNILTTFLWVCNFIKIKVTKIRQMKENRGCPPLHPLLSQSPCSHLHAQGTEPPLCPEVTMLFVVYTQLPGMCGPHFTWVIPTPSFKFMAGFLSCVELSLVVPRPPPLPWVPLL